MSISGPALRLLGRQVGQVALVAVTVVVALTAVSLWFGAWRRAQTVVFNSLSFGLLLSVVISGSATVLLAATGGIVRRLPPIVRWPFWIATFVAAAVIGTFLAPSILWAVRTIPAESVPVIFRQNILGTIPVTIVVGTFIMTVEVWKARVAATNAALQVQQAERERAERLVAEARLASLHARVQPHFLFNTLNAIAALVRDDPPRAERMIEQLSGVLRGSLDTAPIVPIEREMKLVDDYLRIQHARLGSLLRFAVAWDAWDLRGATIPPFAIQTLVENAIRHVAGRREAGVTLAVSVARSGDRVVAEVRDDGPGFEPDALKAGHGLDSLQARLRALYAGEAGLEFDRRPEGMTVRIRVPMPARDA
jgi:sensor histidine kinase YesM